MHLTFLGAAHEVTGSATLIEVGGHYGLVDYGMEQGGDTFANEPIPVDVSKLEFVMLTHAHVDHSGMIPALYKAGYTGPIHATGATCRLATIMLRDCAHIQESEAEWKSRKSKRAGGPEIEPVYTMQDAEEAITHLTPHDYEIEYDIIEGITACFTDAGHLLGSSSIRLTLTEGEEKRTVVFSGDIGNYNQPIIKDPSYFKEADYVITESTYGDRLHETDGSNSINEFAAIIDETLSRGGNLVIPSFAVGRTQELLYFIREIKEKGLVASVPDFPVYMDSPLASEATNVFLAADSQYLDADAKAVVARGLNPLRFNNLHFSTTADESKEINFDPTPKVIISASGMCEAGRIRHHLKHNLWRPECTVMFAGYQAVGSLGRKIIDGAEHVNLFGEEVTVRAEIRKLLGKSGHADKNGLLDWIHAYANKPKMVFVNHGEDLVCATYADQLISEGYNATAPYSGSEFDLVAGSYTRETQGVPLSKKSYAAKKATNAYRMLLSTAQRLLDLVTGFKGRPNSDQRAFKEDLDNLFNKWR